MPTTELLQDPSVEIRTARLWADRVLDPLTIDGDAEPLLEECRRLFPGVEPRLIGVTSSWVLGLRREAGPPAYQARDPYREPFQAMARAIVLAGSVDPLSVRWNNTVRSVGDELAWPATLTALVSSSEEALLSVESTWLLSQKGGVAPHWRPTWDLLTSSGLLDCCLRQKLDLSRLTGEDLRALGSRL